MSTSFWSCSYALSRALHDQFAGTESAGAEGSMLPTCVAYGRAHRSQGVAMGKLLVYTKPVSADVEAEYNRWYDEVHLADVCSVPAITGAQRFKVSATQMAGMAEPEYEYVAVYDFTGPAQAVLDGLAAGGAEWDISPALDGASARVVVVDEAGEPFVP